MKVVYAESDRCLGCRNCERVCAFQKGGGFKMKDTNIWVRVDMEKRTISVTTCLQCERALCQEACPTAAIRRHGRTRAVVVDESLCLGCKVCVTACPFGCIHFNEVKRVAVKCDLCQGDPRCVKHCMAKALHYGNINELARRRRIRLELQDRAGLRGRLDQREAG